MKLLRRPPLWRLFGVVLAALLLSLAGVDAFAQPAGGGGSTALNTAFPYFGPEATVKAMISGAFIAQSQLMGAFSGAKTPMSTLAMFATLIGALMLVFRQSLWRAEVLVPWMVCVILLVFVPINSGLLLTKVTMPRAVHNNWNYGPSNEGRGAVHHGFTPQVAAIDVASRAQLIVSDMFRSTGWRDLKEYVLALQRVRSADGMNMGQPWLQEVNDYSDKHGCTADLATMVAGANQSTPNGNGLVEKGNPETLGNAWSGLRDHFSLPQYADKPPAVVLFFDDADIPGNFDRGLYVQGIQALYNQIVGPKVPRIVEINAGGAGAGAGGGAGAGATGNTISVRGALDAMAAKGFFDTGRWVRNRNTFFAMANHKGYVAPGFFFARFQDFKTQMATPSTGMNMLNTNTFKDMRYCYGSMANSTMGGAIDCSALSTPDHHRETFAVVDNQLAKNGQGSAELAKQIGAEEGDINDGLWLGFEKVFAKVKDMPVYAPRLGVTETISAANGTLLGGNRSLVYSWSNNTGIHCPTRGLELAYSAMEKFVSKSQNLKPLANYMCNMDQKTCRQASGGTIPDQFTLEQISTNTTNNTTASNGQQQLAKALLLYLNGQLRDFAIYQPTVGQSATDAESRRLFLLSEMMRLFGDATTAAVGGKMGGDKNIESRAVEDRDPKVVGWTGLTSWGGWAAQIFGEGLLTIGAFFSGPIAQAYLYFITMMVSMCLLALIVLTPFLLLGGLMMPGSAMGVLTIAIVAAFILQFVPVTMIILNYLGGFIYDMIGATAGSRAAWTMQNMMIFAMAGMYTSVVGLTMYLIFKLGDPATLLGRMAQMDGAAKDIAERGLSAAVAAATVAAAGVMGAGAGAVGRFALGRAASAAGMENEANLLRQAAAQRGAAEENRPGSDGNDQTGSGGTGTDPKNPQDPGSAGFGQKAAEEIGEMNAGQLNADGTPMGEDDAEAEMAQEAAAAAGDGQWAPITERVPNMTLAQQSAFQDNLRNQGRGAEAQHEGQSYRINPDSGRLEVKQAKAKEDLRAGFQQIGDQASGGQQQQSQQVQTLNMGGQPGAAAEGRAPGEAGPEGGPVGGGGAGPQQGGGGQTILVAPAAGGAGQGAAPQGQQRMAAQAAPGVGGQTGQVSAAGATAAASEVSFDHNAATQRTVRMVEIEDQIKRIDATTGGDDKQLSQEMLAQKRDLVVNYEKLKGFDDTGRAIAGVMLSREADDMRREGYVSLDKRLTDDGARQMAREQHARARKELPGYFASAFAGLSGGMGAVGGGVGSIPILGPIVRETLNEFLQAPERARAWKTNGGMMALGRAQRNAQRAAFYNKEISPVGTGQQYFDMLGAGGFDSQVKLARQAASEAVARQRSEGTALAMKTERAQGKGGQGFFSSQEMEGLGKIQAVNRLATVVQEAGQMQVGYMKVLNPKYDPTNAASKEPKELEVKLSTGVMDELGSTLAAKSFTSMMDDNLLRHYGVVEKRYLRDKKEWQATRNMPDSDVARARFMAEDLDTDYLVGGHLKMIEGKISFFNYRGRYEALNGFRNQEQVQVQQWVNENKSRTDAEFLKELNSKDYNGDLVKMAASNSKFAIGKNNLALTAIVENAVVEGRTNYIMKSLEAPSATAAAMADAAKGLYRADQEAIKALVPKLDPAALSPQQIRVGNLPIATFGSAFTELASHLQKELAINSGKKVADEQTLRLVSKTMRSMTDSLQTKGADAQSKAIKTEKDSNVQIRMKVDRQAFDDALAQLSKDEAARVRNVMDKTLKGDSYVFLDEDLTEQVPVGDRDKITKNKG